MKKHTITRTIKKLLILIFISLNILSCNSWNVYKNKKLKNEIIEQGNAFGQLFIDKNFEGFVSKLYPKYVNLYGKDSLINIFKSNTTEREKRQIVFDSVICCNPKEILTSENELQTSVTLNVYSSTWNRKELNRNSAIAISEDKGKTWSFIPLSIYELDSLRKKLPNIHPNIVLHKASKKQISSPTENTPQNVFKVFWDDFKMNYPLFELNKINWDSVYDTNYPKINSNTSDNELYEILTSCILALKDEHCSIISDTIPSIYNTHSIRHQRPKNFIKFKIIRNKLIYPSFKKVTNEIKYGIIKTSKIGYIYIGAFKGNENDYYFIDDLLSKYPMDGLIIDIRENRGGGDNFAKIVASRFTEEPFIYGYYSERIGSNYSDMSGLNPLVLKPGGTKKFTKPIILLTARSTYSAAEDFTLMLKTLPNVIHMGDTTGGGVGTCTIKKDLPNGWINRFSTHISYNRFKKPITNGIPPDISLTISKKNEKQGKDIILENAIKILKEKQHQPD